MITIDGAYSLVCYCSLYKFNVIDIKEVLKNDETNENKSTQEKGDSIKEKNNRDNCYYNSLLSATAAFAVIKTAKKAGRADKSEFETFLHSSKPGTLTRLKKSFKVRS